jgi:hypothetical protein
VFNETEKQNGHLQQTEAVGAVCAQFTVLPLNERITDKTKRQAETNKQAVWVRVKGRAIRRPHYPTVLPDR